VLVEKPMGITLRAASCSRRPPARAGDPLRGREFTPRLGQRAITLAVSTRINAIGDPRLFVIDYITGPNCLWSRRRRLSGAQVNWRNDKFQSGGGWTLDGGIHLMDSLLVYFGEISSVFAEQKTLAPTFHLLADGSRVCTNARMCCIATFHFKNG